MMQQPTYSLASLVTPSNAPSTRFACIMKQRHVGKPISVTDMATNIQYLQTITLMKTITLHDSTVVAASDHDFTGTGNK